MTAQAATIDRVDLDLRYLPDRVTPADVQGRIDKVAVTTVQAAALPSRVILRPLQIRSLSVSAVPYSKRAAGGALQQVFGLPVVELDDGLTPRQRQIERLEREPPERKGLRSSWPQMIPAAGLRAVPPPTTEAAFYEAVDRINRTLP